MHICELCGIEFEKSSDMISSRFCCRKHKAIFNGRLGIKKRKETGTYFSPFSNGHNLVSRSPFGTWKCPHCNFIGETRAKLKEHQHKEHPQFCVEGGWNKGLTKETNESLKISGEKASKTLKEGYASGKIIQHPQSEEFKKKQSIRAKERNLGGWYSSKRIDYNGISMQSSYEVAVAKSLDENQIKWERPNPFQYEMDGKQHRYYPDFYLPDYNVYLDPKNDFLINNPNPRYGIKDSDKIRLVEEQNNVRILILDKNNLDWKNIYNLIVNMV